MTLDFDTLLMFAAQYNRLRTALGETSPFSVFDLHRVMREMAEDGGTDDQAINLALAQVSIQLLLSGTKRIRNEEVAKAIMKGFDELDRLLQPHLIGEAGPFWASPPLVGLDELTER